MKKSEQMRPVEGKLCEYCGNAKNLRQCVYCQGSVKPKPNSKQLNEIRSDTNPTFERLYERLKKQKEEKKQKDLF